MHSEVVLQQGVFKRRLTTIQAVFMITAMTIGAGILGIPYAVAQVGLRIGLIYILVLGLGALALNLLIGDIAARTEENFQFPGLAGKYLGVTAKWVVSVIMVLSASGTLLAYVIGVGESLAALFGGNAFAWSIIFWSIGAFFVWRGLATIKFVEIIISATVLSIVVGICLFLVPHVAAANIMHVNLLQIFLPYGVILFALHAAPAIIEAHALLPQDQKSFRRAVTLGTLIPVLVYALFAWAVVGAMGGATTEIATVGLGARYGSAMLLLGNIFAVLAMGGGFFGLGVALKQSFMWDFKLHQTTADFLVVGIPLLLFVAGLRSFITVLDVVGGLFLGLEAIFLVLIYFRARREGNASAYGLHHAWLTAIPVIVLFGLATLLSVLKILR